MHRACLHNMAKLRGYQFHEDWLVQAGITEVPFGNKPYNSHNYFSSTNYYLGLVAIALLLGGGLTALQAMAVSTGFPFALVLLAASFALVKGLMSEPLVKR